MSKSLKEDLAAFGPGKYDDLCTRVREESTAVAAIVVIVGGERGSGFSVQSLDESFIYVIPDMLDKLSGDIRGLINATRKN